MPIKLQYLTLKLYHFQTLPPFRTGQVLCRTRIPWSGTGLRWSHENLCCKGQYMGPSERIEKKRCMTLMWKDLCKNKSFVTQLCVYIWLFRLCFISKIILLIQYLYLIYLLHYLAFEALCLPVYHWLIWLIVWLIDFRIPVSTWNWSSYSVSWWSEA